MKLTSKTLLYFFIISLPLLILAGYLSYYFIKDELRDGSYETLLREKLHAEKLINSMSEQKTVYLSSDSLSVIFPVKVTGLPLIVKDTTIFDQIGQEEVNFMVLRSAYHVGNKNYQLTLMKPTIEEDELLEGILTSFSIIVGFLFFAFIIVNWLLSKILWKPFYKTLFFLNNYEIKKSEHVSLTKENVIEFNQLNNVLNKMFDKTSKDYFKQKEFTENASHEMQTPLAVIKANLNLLIQSENLKENDMNKLQVIENTINKLSSINKALILLSKIENNQFISQETVSIKEVIEKNLGNYSDVISAKKIQLSFIKENDLLVKMNPSLADVLISNLLQNSIRHNIKDGIIDIIIRNNKLIICNSGLPLITSPTELFERFKKDDASKESLGLGLSIVKSIVTNYGFTIEYSYNKDLHLFTLIF